ncbi:hypothetical protein ABK040_013691 [Willaertia magna]
MNVSVVSIELDVSAEIDEILEDDFMPEEEKNTIYPKSIVNHFEDIEINCNNNKQICCKIYEANLTSQIKQ